MSGDIWTGGILGGTGIDGVIVCKFVIPDTEIAGVWFELTNKLTDCCCC